jgi:hypothetical protein
LGRAGLVLWHKPNSVPAFARWRSFISPGFPSAQPHFQVSPETPIWPSARPGSGAGCDYYPRGFSRIREKSGQATLPSALSCTTWGFSCGSAYANARWALTPPFHPYPAPSSFTFRRKALFGLPWGLKVDLDGTGRYVFCDTVRHPGFTSRAPPISRGMLPSGVRTFLWRNKRQASDHPPQWRS